MRLEDDKERQGQSDTKNQDSEDRRIRLHTKSLRKDVVFRAWQGISGEGFGPRWSRQVVASISSLNLRKCQA